MYKRHFFFLTLRRQMSKYAPANDDYSFVCD